LRTLRYLSIGLLVVLALTVAAAWVVPGMMDWDRYRETVEALASAALGRPVRIDGRITLELLPDPILTAAAVSIDAEGGLAISARDLRLRVAPGALLSGTIDARELVLRDPVMRVPWPLPPGSLSFHRPAWLAALSARIEGGTLSVGEVTFTGIDATLVAGDEGGGYRLAGTVRRDGSWRFTARLSGRGGDGAAGLDLTLDGMETRQGLGARFTGQLDGEGMLAGRLDAQGPNLSRLLPAPSVAFHASGRLTLASGLLAADELALDIGGSPARGAVALRLVPRPRLDLALAASRLDLDAWLPALLQAPPAAYPVGVDLSAEAAQLAGGTVRRLRVAFDVAAVGADPGVLIREASAILPGEATLRLSGAILRADAAHPAFTGTVRLGAPEFRTTLHWLDAGVLHPLSSLPPDILRSLDLSGTVAADAEHLSLTGLHGQVDNAGLDGTLAVGFGPRLAIVANLATDRLLLDPWLPASWPALSDLPQSLPPFDADIRLSATRARYLGLTLAPLATDLAIEQGRLHVRRLDVTVQGVAVQLSGNVAENGRVTDAHLALDTKDASVLAPLLPVAWRLPALWEGPASLQMQGDGPPGALGLKIAAELGDLRLEAQPTLDLPNAGWAGPITVRHPGAPRLLETLGLTSAPSWLGDGSFSLVAGLAVTPHQIRAEKLELIAGALRADGQLTLIRGASEPVLSGRITAETMPLPGLTLHASAPLPLAWLHFWHADLQVEAAQVLIGLAPMLEHASATLALADGVLQVNGLKAMLGSGTLLGTASFDTATEPPMLRLQATAGGIAITDPSGVLPLDVVGGQAGGSLTATASGHSPAALLATLDGQAQATLRNGALTGFDLSQVDDGLRHDAADSALTAALAGGNTGFDTLELSAAIRRGRIVLGDCHMQGTYGAADFSGSIDPAGAALDLRVVVHPNVPEAPTLGLRLTGPMDAVRRIPELAGVTTWRAAQPGH